MLNTQFWFNANRNNSSSSHLCGALITSLLLLSTPCLAQAPQTRPPGTSDVLVDGAVNPSQIPDDIAYVHFFQVLMKNPISKDPKADEMRRQSYVRHYFSLSCGATNRTLTPAQRDNLLAVVDKVTVEYLAAHSRMVASGGQAGYDAARQSIQALTVAVFNGLYGTDPDLAAKVKDHVREHVKGTIKIISAKIPQQL